MRLLTSNLAALDKVLGKSLLYLDSHPGTLDNHDPSFLSTS